MNTKVSGAALLASCFGEGHATWSVVSEGEGQARRGIELKPPIVIAVRSLPVACIGASLATCHPRERAGLRGST